MKKTLCLDIGGTNIRAAIVTGSQISNHRETKTPKTKSTNSLP